jgi:hypothetical protein
MMRYNDAAGAYNKLGSNAPALPAGLSGPITWGFWLLSCTAAARIRATAVAWRILADFSQLHAPLIL